MGRQPRHLYGVNDEISGDDGAIHVRGMRAQRSTSAARANVAEALRIRTRRVLPLRLIVTCAGEPIIGKHRAKGCTWQGFSSRACSVLISALPVQENSKFPPVVFAPRRFIHFPSPPHQSLPLSRRRNIRALYAPMARFSGVFDTVNSLQRSRQLLVLISRAIISHDSWSTGLFRENTTY